MTEEKLNPKLRKRKVLEAAVELSRIFGVDHITRDAVAKKAGVGHGTVTLYYNTMTQLKRAVARQAISESDPEILSQLLVHPLYRKKLSQAHKRIALDHLAG